MFWLAHGVGWIGLGVSFSFFYYSLPRVRVSAFFVLIVTEYGIIVRVCHVVYVTVISTSCGLRLCCWVVSHRSRNRNQGHLSRRLMILLKHRYLVWGSLGAHPVSIEGWYLGLVLHYRRWVVVWKDIGQTGHFPGRKLLGLGRMCAG